MEHQDCLIRWLFGDRKALDSEVWEIPMLEWRQALHCVIEGFYAATQRSDWREAKVKNIWKTIAEFTEFSLWGYPYQDVEYMAEEGRPAEPVSISNQLPF